MFETITPVVWEFYTICVWIMDVWMSFVHREPIDSFSNSVLTYKSEMAALLYRDCTYISEDACTKCTMSKHLSVDFSF